MSNPIVINPSGVVALSERLGASGNQARLNNGCVCDSGCEQCDRLANDCDSLAMEHKDLLRAARALVWHLTDRKFGRATLYTKEDAIANLISVVTVLEASNE